MTQEDINRYFQYSGLPDTPAIRSVFQTGLEMGFKKGVERCTQWLEGELYDTYEDCDIRNPCEVRSSSYFTTRELIEGLKSDTLC